MKELPPLAGERTHHRRGVERAVIQIHQVNAPLARRRVVEAQRLGLDMKFLVRASHFELFEVRVAIEKLVMVRDAVVLDPDIRVVEPVREPANVSLPVSDQKIEIMRAVVLRQVGRISRSLRPEWSTEHGSESEPGQYHGSHR